LYNRPIQYPSKKFEQLILNKLPGRELRLCFTQIWGARENVKGEKKEKGVIIPWSHLPPPPPPLKKRNIKLIIRLNQTGCLECSLHEKLI
jgi:hypothetical protein